MWTASLSRDKLENPILGWVSLLCSTVCFFGFVGLLFRKPGKGGGTAGSIVTFGLQVLLLHLEVSFWVMLCLVVFSFVFGWVVITPAEALMRRKVEAGRWKPRKKHTGKITEEDYNETCIDEVHGQLVAGLPVWIFNLSNFVIAIAYLLAALVLFRVFDAYKIGYVGKVERRYEGTAFGIMIDDTVAGFMAAVCTWLFLAL